MTRTCDRCHAECPDDAEWYLTEECDVICADCSLEFDDDDLYEPEDFDPWQGYDDRHHVDNEDLTDQPME